MAEDTGEESGNSNRSAEEAALSARLQRLGERLAHQKGRPGKPKLGSSSKSDPSALARGFRLSTELVAGVLVGAFIGWALDKWLGISPWGMIVFLLARLCRRRRQRDARCGRFQRTGTTGRK